MAHDGTVKIGTKLDESGLKKGLSEIGGFAQKGIGVVVKGFAAMSAAGTAAASAIAKKTIESYASYEQLIGGVETLFKDAADAVEHNADMAFQTAGMSANKYMETVTSFSASLLQSLNGDTAKAAEVADMAIIDMSDNANKMGTSMESIQNAYQGFAKQNYTMLDNLKLGYGGTKEEMKRLLEDAQKLTGVKYDISNLNDVYSAIHAVQNELGITGTTAKEASTTIEGSVASAKSAWENLLNAMGGGLDISEHVDAFVDAVDVAASNILPIAENALEGISTLIEKLLPKVADRIPSIISTVAPKLLNAGVGITKSLLNGIGEQLPAIAEFATQLADTFVDNLPEMAQKGIDIVGDICNGIVEAIPTVIEYAWQIVQTIGQTIIDNLGGFMERGAEIIQNLANGISQNLPTVIDTALSMITQFANTILANAPQLISSGLALVQNLATGILNNLPTIVSTGTSVITNALSTIASMIPQFLETGKEILISLVGGIVESLPNIIDSAIKVISTLINTLGENFPAIVQAGLEIVIKLITGLIDALPQLVKCIPTLVKAIVDGFKSFSWIDLGLTIIKTLIIGLFQMAKSLWDVATSLGKTIIDAFKGFDLVDAGKNLVKGLWNGIKDMGKWIKDKIKSFGSDIVDGFKSVFGIKSPSRVLKKEVGVYLPQGIEAGIEEETPDLLKTSEEMAEDTVNAIKNASNIDAAGVVDSFQARAYSYTNDAAQEQAEIVKDGVDISNSNAIEPFDYAAMGNEMKQAVDGMKVDMDGRTVGKVVAPAVNDELGRLNNRRT